MITRKFRALAFGALLIATPLAAQGVADPNDPVERLGRYVRVLAADPRDLSSLLGAGRAALDVGDANAALGFFARAEQVAPTSGRAKAGLASSLVMIERPDDALRLFGEAVSLGIPEGEIARDRGLAYDLRGDPARAQRDYALAATRGSDDELVRRWSLSQGISGDRSGALARLDPLLRRQDQGAWRARAFILAMTGDVSGANTVAHQLMPMQMADAMSPLLTRLATLNPSERAHAVNFGTVPGSATQLASRSPDPFDAVVAARPEQFPPPAPITTGSGLIPTGEPFGAAHVQREPDSREPRRRPGQVEVATPRPQAQPAPTTPVAPPTTSRIGERVGMRIAAVDPARLPPEARGVSNGGVSNPMLTSSTSLPVPGFTTPPVVAASTPTPTPTPTPAPAPAPVPAVAARASGADTSAVAVSSTGDVAGPPAATATVQSAKQTPVQPVAQPIVQPVASPTVAPVARLAGLVDTLEREPETSAVELPSAREMRNARAAARRKVAELAAQAEAERKAEAERAAAALAAKRNPARIWVQVATGARDDGLGISWRRLQGAHAELKRQSAWSAEWKRTNRLLVGPMRSSAAARDLVRALGKDGLSAMTYSSEAGEEVVKLGQ